MAAMRRLPHSAGRSGEALRDHSTPRRMSELRPAPTGALDKHGHLLPEVRDAVCNKHRRHMTPSKLALATGKAKKYIERMRSEAKERQNTKGGHSGPVTLPDAKGDTRDKAGKARANQLVNFTR